MGDRIGEKKVKEKDELLKGAFIRKKKKGGGRKSPTERRRLFLLLMHNQKGHP